MPLSRSLFQASKAWRKNKMDESKHEIHSQVDAITAGTASVVNLTAGRPDAKSYLYVLGVGEEERVQAPSVTGSRWDCPSTQGRDRVSLGTRL